MRRFIETLWVVLFFSCLGSSVGAKPKEILCNDCTQKVAKKSLKKREIPKPAQPKEYSFDREQIVNLALQNRPSLKGLQFATAAQRATQVKTLSAYLPQLSATNLLFTETGVEGFRNAITFSGTQLIYSFANPFDLYRIAGNDTDAALLTELAHKDFIRNEAEVAFLQAWMLQQQRFPVESEFRSAQAVFDRDSESNNQELLDKNDWLKSKVTYATGTIDASVYDENLSIAQSVLERIVAQPLPGNLERRSERIKGRDSVVLHWQVRDEESLLSSESYVQKAYEWRKEIKIKEKEIEKDREFAQYNLKNYLPSITLYGNLSHGTDIPGEPKNFREAGLRFNWTFFDGLSNYRDYQVSRANMMRATMEKQTLKNQIREQVETVYQQVRQQSKLLKVSAVSLAQAENEYTLRKQQFGLGLIAQPDLDVAKFNHETAYYTWLKQRIQVEINTRNLYFVCGYPQDGSLTPVFTAIKSEQRSA